jgi:hypothetical protein
MARLKTPEEAAEAARVKQAAKVAAVAAKRLMREAAREARTADVKLFAAHCADAAKAFRAGDFEGAAASVARAGLMAVEAGGG